MASKNFDITPIGNSLAGVVQRVFQDNTPLNMEDEAVINKVKIIEFEGKMKVIAMDKFNGPTYVSTTSYYASEINKDKHKAVGALILYLEASHSEKILKAFGHKEAVEEDEEKTLEGCAKFSTMIAESFKSELSSRGYSNLVMSESESYRNEVPIGVDFSYDQSELCEVRFMLNRKEFLVFDITMAAVGKR